MGNNSNSILLKHEDLTIPISLRDTSFENIKSHIQSSIPHLKGKSLTIQHSRTNTFISTNYKWNLFPIVRRNTFLVLEQVSDSVTKDIEIASVISKSMFKILNGYQKVVGTGFKLSSYHCLIPSFIVKTSFSEFCSSHTIEFFDDSTGTFKSDGDFYPLGRDSLDRCFCLIEIEGFCEPCTLESYILDKRVSGKIIYFDKKKQMLESLPIANVKIYPKRLYFNLCLKQYPKGVPGGVIVSDDKEILGINLSFEYDQCISMATILKQISKVFDAHRDNDVLLRKLAEIRGLIIREHAATRLLGSALQINVQELETKNRFDTFNQLE